jgi:hypothetical protein
MSFTTCLVGDIVALGDSIRALLGGIAENWPSVVKVQCVDEIITASRTVV